MRASVSPGGQGEGGRRVRTLDALIEVMNVGADRCGATQTAEMLDEFRREGRSGAEAAAADKGSSAY